MSREKNPVNLCTISDLEFLYCTTMLPTGVGTVHYHLRTMHWIWPLNHLTGAHPHPHLTIHSDNMSNLCICDWRVLLVQHYSLAEHVTLWAWFTRIGKYSEDTPPHRSMHLFNNVTYELNRYNLLLPGVHYAAVIIHNCVFICTIAIESSFGIFLQKRQLWKWNLIHSTPLKVLSYHKMYTAY